MEFIENITTGDVSLAIIAFITAGWSLFKIIAKKTKTTKDDAVVAYVDNKIEEIKKILLKTEKKQ